MPAFSQYDGYIKPYAIGFASKSLLLTFTSTPFVFVFPVYDGLLKR
jgi:hypothetical protein